MNVFTYKIWAKLYFLLYLHIKNVAIMNVLKNCWILLQINILYLLEKKNEFQSLRVTRQKRYTLKPPNTHWSIARAQR